MAGAWILILLTTCTARAGSDVDDLRATLEMHSREVMVGEPLVVTVGLTNTGKGAVITIYAKPGAFRLIADVDISVRSGSTVVLSKAVRSGVAVYPIDPSKAASLVNVADITLEPGGVLSQKRTIALVRKTDERLAWLNPGTYEIQAEIHLQGHSTPFKTPAERFTIKSLALEQQGVLSFFGTELVPLLEGAAPDLVTQEILAKSAKLKKNFPRSPHRQYLEYCILDSYDKLAAYGPAARAYLEEFTKSPHVDDVLWNLGWREKKAGEYDKAAAHLETLLRDYPQSPLKKEAEELLAKVKAARKQKAGQEGKAVPPEARDAGQPQSPNPPPAAPKPGQADAGGQKSGSRR
jgi:TolA-binding protein